MTHEEKQNLIAILNPTDVRQKIAARVKALEYVQSIEITPENASEAKNEPQKGKPKRTQSQHNSLFLWFSMIEHEAANQGVMWDMIMKHTHQLKITKDGLHLMCKQLIEPLFGIKSTKDIEKTGHLDDIIDHFTDLLSKEMEFIPEFPHDPDKGNDTLKAHELRKKLEKEGVV